MTLVPQGPGVFILPLAALIPVAGAMCPIALGTASALGVNPDSFLMAVAIGASCASLTPISHQNNTLGVFALATTGVWGCRWKSSWRRSALRCCCGSGPCDILTPRMSASRARR